MIVIYSYLVRDNDKVFKFHMNKSSVIRQKGESQNGCFKKTI